MGKAAKTLQKVLGGKQDANIEFADLCHLFSKRLKVCSNGMWNHRRPTCPPCIRLLAASADGAARRKCS